MQDELFTWYQMNTEQEKEEFLADLIAADSEEEEDMIIAEMGSADSQTLILPNCFFRRINIGKIFLLIFIKKYDIIFIESKKVIKKERGFRQCLIKFLMQRSR